MIYKFDRLYNLFMEDINTKRSPVEKVDAMSPKEFLRFLKEFLPYIKDGKVDLNEIRISEKIDGSSIRLLTVNGEMMFESSYSGVTTWDKVPMRAAAKFLYDNYSQQFNNIFNLLKSDFKIIGELIWIDGMENNGKVTPVGASYLTSKFGKYGGIVIFDILKIEDNNLVPFDESIEEKVFNMIRDLNNEDFSFYLTETIDITKNVTFDLDVNELTSLINNPEFNKERFSPKADRKILDEIEKIKTNVCQQLSRTIDNTRGSFSEEGDLIEGIVVRIKSSGHQFGMFSDGYKKMKESYWVTFYQIEAAYKEFFKSVFGCDLSRKKKIIPTLNEDIDAFKEKFEEIQPVYAAKIKNLFDSLVNDESIPKAAKNSQVSMARRFVDKSAESDYHSFVNKYIFFNKEDTNEN